MFLSVVILAVTGWTLSFLAIFNALISVPGEFCEYCTVSSECICSFGLWLVCKATLWIKHWSKSQKIWALVLILPLILPGAVRSREAWSTFSTSEQRHCIPCRCSGLRLSPAPADLPISQQLLCSSLLESSSCCWAAVTVSEVRPESELALHLGTRWSAGFL